MYRTLLACWPDPGEFLAGVREPETIMTDANRLAAGRDDIATLLFWDALFYLPNDNLVKVDRASMAVSLEMRVPLLDHEVIEQVWRMPEALRVGPGPSKWLLRQILYRYVPQRLVDRQKRGFTVPLSAWLRGPLRRWAEEVLFDRACGVEDLVDRETVRRRWREHLEGRRNWHLGIWALVNLKMWQNDTRGRPAPAGRQAAADGRGGAE
jgi:asparagine synthase (glutamine-hydrolysing)